MDAELREFLAGLAPTLRNDLFIGFDPATKYGYCVMRADGSIVVSGAWDLSLERGQSPGVPMLKLCGYIEELEDTYDLKHCFAGYELVEAHMRYVNGKPQANTYAAQMYGKYLGMTLATLEARHVEFCGFPVGTIKKHATGRGNANKEDMLNACMNKYGKVTNDDNEADAVAIADLMRTTVLECQSR